MITVVVLGFVLRLGWLFYALRDPVGLGDPHFYASSAERIAAGRGYVLESGEATALWPPGYSYALAVPTWILRHTPVPGGTVEAAAALNLVVGTLTIAIVGLMARRMIGQTGGVVAAGLTACFPSLVMFTATVLTETLFTFLAMGSIAIMVWVPWKRTGNWVVLPSGRRLVAAGAVAGLASLVRPTFLPSLLLVPVAIWITSRDRGLTVRRSAAFLVPIVAVMGTWTVRNAVAMDAFVPVSTNTGYNLCIGNNPDAIGAYNTSPYCFDGLPLDDSTHAELERNDVTTERGKEWILENPADQFSLVPLRVFRLLANDSSGVTAVLSYGLDPWMSQSELIWWSSIADAYYFGVLAIAVLGALTWRSDGDRRKLLLMLILAGAVLAVIPFFGDTRFKVPMMPLVAIFAVEPLRQLARPQRSPVE